MKKNFLIIFFVSIFLFSNSYALDFNKVYNVKIFSSAKLEVNDTNLVDNENVENLVNNIENLNVVLKEKSDEIKKQNRNRKKNYSISPTNWANWISDILYESDLKIKGINSSRFDHFELLKEILAKIIRV